MHLNIRRPGTAMLAATVAVGALALPGASAARVSYTLSCKTSGDNPSNPTDITATLTCKSPFGKGKQTGKLVLPQAVGKWSFRRGAFKYVGVGKIDGQTARSTVRLTKGAGRFKGCSGKGRQTYDLKSARGKATVKITCRRRIN
jgi:hypothetical protein